MNISNCRFISTLFSFFHISGRHCGSGSRCQTEIQTLTIFQRIDGQKVDRCVDRQMDLYNILVDRSIDILINRQIDRYMHIGYIDRYMDIYIYNQKIYRLTYMLIDGQIAKDATQGGTELPPPLKNKRVGKEIKKVR